MGTSPPAQRVLLGEGRRHRRLLFTDPHHRCLGSQRSLPYSAHRGKKSVNREALDDLKEQIPLMGYLQAQDWRPARPLSRGRWMGCALCMEITTQASWWITTKASSTVTAVAGAVT